MTAGKERHRTTGAYHYYNGETRYGGQTDFGDGYVEVDPYIIPNGVSFAPSYASCFDVVGNRKGNNPLYLTKEHGSPASVSMTIMHAQREPEFPINSNMVTTETRTLIPNHCLYNGEEDESDVAFITRGAAELNPSRADFDSATFIGELRDVPKLFQSVGSSMAKYGANEYLKYQYGWKPLVADVKKFMSIVDNVEKRLRQIDRLQRDGILKKTYRPKDRMLAFKSRTFTPTIDTVPQYYWPEVSFNGNGYGLQTTTQMRTERWAQLTWSAESGGLPPPTDQQQLMRARRAVYGGVIDGNTLWQLMPWSWLLDWTSNASEYLQSQRDVVGAKLSHTLLMKTTQLQSECTPVYPEYPDFDRGYGASFDWRATPGRLSSIIKERIVGVMPEVEITSELSLLGKDPFKLSILGALGIQRLKGL